VRDPAHTICNLPVETGTQAPSVLPRVARQESEGPIKIRQTKYLHNIIEQDHRAIKRRTRPMLGFKTFRCARILLGGIEIMHMIVKGQLLCARRAHPSVADQFHSLAA
jgi:transposase-like protein